jgi:hypothetical protein
MSIEFQLVEFIGGPFDGHRLRIAATRRDLAPVATFSVNKNVLQLLSGAAPGPVAPVTSTAVYQLEWARGAARYRFLKARQPSSVSAGGTSGEL